jgi:anti-sigma regulatory factor (Ser/Thr protein kinase)
VSADGPPLKLCLAGDSAALESARVAVLDYLAPFAPGAKAVYAVELVLEEVLTNQFKYAAAPIDLMLHVEPRLAVLQFEDGGAAFDPLQAPTPPSPSSLDEAKVGGLGLMLVRRFARTARYERIGERNRLTIGVTLG